MSKLAFVAAAALAFAGCATKPATVSDQYSLQSRANATLGAMRAKDARIDQVLGDAYAYAVFPDIGKAGAGAVGAAFGRGVLYQHGQKLGFVKLEQASAGAELGGQTYAELLVLRHQGEVNKLENGELDLNADASAVLVKSGAALSTDSIRGAMVFIMPRGGAMVEATVAGQRIEFEPAG
jgi:lipid-binding SYLF domain-containing protein